MGFRNFIRTIIFATALTAAATASEVAFLEGWFITSLIDEHLGVHKHYYGIDTDDPIAGSLHIDANGSLIPAEPSAECEAPQIAQRIDISITREVETQGTTLRTEYVVTSRILRIPTNEITHEEQLITAVVENAEAAEFLGVPDYFALEPIFPALLVDLLARAGVSGFADACGMRVADYPVTQ